MKTCVKCSSEFEGRYCLECNRKRANKYYRDNQELVKEQRKEYYSKNVDNIREYSKDYRTKNKEKISMADSLYYIENADLIKKRTREWASENPDAMANSGRKWRENNKEKVFAANKRYREENKGKVSYWRQQRRAKKFLAGGNISKELPEKLFILQRGLCPCCGKELGEDYHLDHIVPISKGGSNTDENIQLLRARCNLQKGAKDPIEFMQSRGFLL